MHGMNRRDFMKTAATTIGAGLVASTVARGQDATAAPAAPPEKLTLSTQRKLGNTGITCSLVGMGTGVRSWNGSSALTRLGRDTYMEVLSHAYSQGIRYFDLADMYGAHPYVKDALAGTFERDKVTILTKTVSREADLIKADLERFRQELNTDYLDIVLMHCLTDNETPDWPTKYAACRDALSEAKEKGVIRAHGVSCHSLAALREAADCPWVDVILARINPYGEKMDGPPEDVAPVLQKAHASGKGILGMKIVGEGALADRIPQSLQFVMGLGCVDAMPIGFLSTAEIDGFRGHVEALASA